MNPCEAFFSLKQFGRLYWIVMDKGKQVVTANSDASGNGSTTKKIHAFVDRSKLKILLCDTNVNNCREVATLLRRCSYQGAWYHINRRKFYVTTIDKGDIIIPKGVCKIAQLHLHADIGRLLLTVTSVGSTREAIHVLSCEGASIDIVLAEADLPTANCMNILKYITQDQDLQCIPVIMLVAQDSISMIAKCLIHGAVDYLMTPLGSNELLNLWTHAWRTRRMLGLPEKNIFHCDVKRFMTSTIYADDAYGERIVLQDRASSSHKQELQTSYETLEDAG